MDFLTYGDSTAPAVMLIHGMAKYTLGSGGPYCDCGYKKKI